MAITLNSGFKMPIIGLGVWRMDGKDIKNLLLNAIKIGYRHLDCAADYRNEAEVGEALLEAFNSGLVKREDLFITTKLWNSDHGHVIEACKDSLKKLQLDYLDLYLVHFPVATKHTGVGTTDSALGEDGVLDIDTTISLETTWHAMEELVSMGLVRSIGISNYDIFLTRDCLAYAKVKPAGMSSSLASLSFLPSASSAYSQQQQQVFLLRPQFDSIRPKCYEPLIVEAKARTRQDNRIARHSRLRKKVEGTPERPRLCVFRSNKHIYVQVIDDTKMHTLASASTMQKPISEEFDFSSGPTIDVAKKVGEAIAKSCLEKGISKVAFDRGGYPYHGRIEALADAAREHGLQF